MTTKGMGISTTDEWLTPPEIIKSLGEFDLDPCSPVNRPWDTAKTHYTINDDGLLLPWDGRVWMNPPYGRALDAWMNKMALHGNGIALIFARTDTNTFHNYVFAYADSILFIQQRLKFYDIRSNNLNNEGNAGAPSILIAYGNRNVEALGDSGIKGKHLLVNSVPVITIQVSRTWKQVVSISLHRIGRPASLKEIYDTIEIIAPDKIEKNAHYQEKTRQVLQTYFTRIAKGQYTYEVEQ